MREVKTESGVTVRYDNHARRHRWTDKYADTSANGAIRRARRFAARLADLLPDIDIVVEHANDASVISSGLWALRFHHDAPPTAEVMGSVYASFYKGVDDILTMEGCPETPLYDIF